MGKLENTLLFPTDDEKLNFALYKIQKMLIFVFFRIQITWK